MIIIIPILFLTNLTNCCLNNFIINRSPFLQNRLRSIYTPSFHSTPSSINLFIPRHYLRREYSKLCVVTALCINPSTSAGVRRPHRGSKSIFGWGRSQSSLHRIAISSVFDFAGYERTTSRSTCDIRPSESCDFKGSSGGRRGVVVAS